MKITDRNRFLLKKEHIYCISILMYIVLNAVLITHHEAWRDEAQAWTIARNLTIPEIIDLLPTEGHPISFFLILKLWYKLGGAYAWIGIISLSFMTIIVGVILCKAPFPIWINVLIIFSPICFYYNAVISRCYCIMALALVFVAVSRRKKDEKPVVYCLAVAFLVQTHVLVIPLAMGLCVELLFDTLKGRLNKDKLWSVFIPLMSLFSVFLELYQRKKTAYITFDTILGNFAITNPQVLHKRVKTVVTFAFGSGRVHIIVSILLIIALIIALLLISTSLMGEKGNSIRKASSEMIISGFGITGYLAIICFVRECAHVQMALVFYWILFFAAWSIQDVLNSDKKNRTIESSSLSRKRDKLLIKVVYIALLLIVILSYKKEFADIKYDYYNNYSNSKAMAKEMIDYLPEESMVLIRQEDYRISAPYAYLMDKRDDVIFWDVDEKREYTCIIWGKEYPETDLRKYAKKMNRNVYYLTSKRIEDMGTPVLATKEPNPWEENYFLYDMNKWELKY